MSAFRFWPVNIGAAVRGDCPEDLLRAAADELGPLTNFEAVAEVEARGDVLAFVIVGEAAGFRHTIAYLRGRLTYPCKFVIPASAQDGVDMVTQVEVPMQLEATLVRLFTSDDIQGLVGSVRRLTRGMS